MASTHRTSIRAALSAIEDDTGPEPDLLKPCQRYLRQDTWLRATRRAAKPCGPNFVFALGTATPESRTRH